MTLWSWSQHRRKSIFLMFTICWIPCVNKACQHIEPELHVCQPQKILMETGFVNFAEFGQPRKINETQIPGYLEEDQSRSYLSCLTHPCLDGQDWGAPGRLSGSGCLYLLHWPQSHEEHNSWGWGWRRCDLWLHRRCCWAGVRSQPFWLGSRRGADYPFDVCWWEASGTEGLCGRLAGIPGMCDGLTNAPILAAEHCRKDAGGRAHQKGS